LIEFRTPLTHETIENTDMERRQSQHLRDLLDAARKVVLTPQEKEEQRRSFAYGNTKIGNPCITREMVDREAEALGAPKDVE
jgi:hypothetical protein